MGVSMYVFLLAYFFMNMSGFIQKCISWILSLFCMLVLGNIIHELHVFSNENSGHHSDMAIRQNYDSESAQKFEMKQTDGSNDWDKFTEFGKFERNQYDYDDIQYPIPFNVLVSNISMRYENYGISVGSPSYVLTGNIPRFQYQKSDVLMVTGASDDQAFASFNCLYSMVLADPYASYLYIDFGLTDKERNILFAHFESIRQVQLKMKSNGFIAYRKFKWNSFPKWMWTEKNIGKVIAHMDAAFAWKGITMWNDGGNLIREGISREITNARVDGVYSPPSEGNQKRWTHPDTANFLIQHHLIDHFSYDDPNCSTGLIVSDWSHSDVVERVLYPYYQCAFTQKCVSPRNSNKDNHRQDQSVLSALLNNIKPRRSMNWDFDYHPAFHWEFGNDEEKCKKISGNLLRSIQDTYQIRIDNTYIPRSIMKYTRLDGPYVSRMIDREWKP